MRVLEHDDAAGAEVGVDHRRDLLGRDAPGVRRTPRMMSPEWIAGPPHSYTRMCVRSSARSTEPGFVCARSADWFAIVAVGKKSAASCPSSSAIRRCSSFVVGSSRYCSSPTSAAAIAARIPAVGFVSVSERRSITEAQGSLQPMEVELLGLVRAQRARPAVAGDARPVRDPRERGHGAADADRPRRPRWERWLECWPTVDALASAEPGDVIRDWQGLGYNRRALNLHRAAQQIAAHGWPDDLTELPGVGRYTADALARFAFGRDVLPVDVNVRRVAERTGHAFSPAARRR